jgi:Golgi nucleoside diphosphatase
VASVNYGIVIDAGSSSSKVYLFQWPTHDGDPTKLLKIKPLTDELDDPLTSKVEPGEHVRGEGAREEGEGRKKIMTPHTQYSRNLNIC